MSTGSLMPVPVLQFFDGNGDPLAGGLLYAFLAGTTTPATVYQDASLTTPHSNPVVLDAAGRASVYLDALSYKFVLTADDGAPVWTMDQVTATHASAESLGEIKSLGGASESPVTATAYPVGSGFDKCHAGTVLWAIDSAVLFGTYALQGMLIGSGGTITVALVNLTDGSPETPIASLTSANAAGELVESSPITFATGGAAKTYGIKVKVSAGHGYAWGLSIVRIG